MTKLCILSPTHWGSARGGAEYQAHVLAEHIVATTDHDVVYLARDVPADSTPYDYEISHFAGPKLLSSLKWGRSVDSVALYRQLVELKPDVILSLVASAYIGVAAWYASRFSIPLVIYLASDSDVERFPNVGIDGPARVLDRVLYRYGIRRASQVIAQTRKQAQALPNVHKRTANDTIANFHPVPDRQPKPQSPITVLWVANLKPLKQPELFIRLAEEFNRENESEYDVRFVLVGRQGPSDWAKAIATKAAQLNNCEYVGEQSLEEVNQLMQQAHVFVNTSLYEGFPNTFIQAWMREVPTLSINVDPDDVMQKQGMGKRCETYEELLATLRLLIRDEAARAAMGVKAYNYARQQHSMDNANRVLSVVLDTLGQRFER